MTTYKLFTSFSVTIIGVLFSNLISIPLIASTDLNELKADPKLQEISQIQNELISCKRDQSNKISTVNIIVDGVQRTTSLPSNQKCLLIELKYRNAYLALLSSNSDLAQYLTVYSIDTLLSVFHKNRVADVAGVNIQEFTEEFNSLKNAWVNGFSALKPNDKNLRSSGVCLPHEEGFLLSAASFAQVEFDVDQLAGLILHEALCSIPLKKEKSLWPWSHSKIIRKYDDTNYQKSALIIAYAHLIKENDPEKINFFETHWLKKEPQAPQSLTFNDAGAASNIQIASGGISGGPGGGDAHALWLKIYLLQDLLERQWQCHTQKTETSPWGEYAIPCDWITSPWLQRAFIRMPIEELPLDANLDFRDYLIKPEYQKIANSVVVSFPFHQSEGELIQRDIFIELGFLYSAQRSYIEPKMRDQIMNQIWSPCFSGTDKKSVCFFH